MSESPLPYRDAPVANPCRPSVIKAWTDYNDHFNVAYYTRAFDLAAEAWRATLSAPGSVRGDGGADGGADVIGATTVRSTVSYLREVHLGRALEMTTQVLAASDQMVHLLQAMYVVEDGYLAAIEERVDRFTASDGAPRTLGAESMATLAAIAGDHANLPVPDGWGTLDTTIA